MRWDLVVQTLAAINVRRWSLYVVGGLFLLAVFSMLVGISLLVAARLGAFLVFVPEFPVVPTGVVGLQRLFGGAAAAISGVRALANSFMRATVFGMPAVKQHGVRCPISALVARPCCRDSKGRCSLW